MARGCVFNSCQDEFEETFVRSGGYGGWRPWLGHQFGSRQFWVCRLGSSQFSEDYGYSHESGSNAAMRNYVGVGRQELAVEAGGRLCRRASLCVLFMSDARTDPKRIDPIIELVRQAWRMEPGFRLTQLLMVVTEKTDGGHLFVDDETLERRLRAFIGSTKIRID